MTRSITAATTLAVLSVLATGALAATTTRQETVIHRPVSTKQTSQVMSEKENKSPSLAAVFAASDGVIYDPPTTDPRSHGLPNF